MTTLFRPTYRNKNGQQRESSRWWVRYSLAGKTLREGTGLTDKRAAELRAAEIVRRAEMKAAGISDPFEQYATVPLREHVDDFLAELSARDLSEKYLADRIKCLREFQEASAITRLSDLTPEVVTRWMGQLRGRKLSARSVNRRLAAVRQLGRWLRRARRLAFDPFDGVKPLNDKTDRRHVRRALTAVEITRLLDAARERPLEAARAARTRTGLTELEVERLERIGQTRALIYALALGTGLRRGELQRLRHADVDLESGMLTVPAISAKAKREQRVPLRKDLCERLRTFVAHSALGETTSPVFPTGSFPAIRTFWKDLEYADIPRRDEDGRVVDFHALRTTFVSGLAAAGVHPRVAQALARHSSVDLTMSAYTDLSLLDLRGAVEELPIGDAQHAPERYVAEEQGADALCHGLCRSMPTSAHFIALTRTREAGQQSPPGDRGNDASRGHTKGLDVGAPDRIRTDDIQLGKLTADRRRLLQAKDLGRSPNPLGRSCNGHRARMSANPHAAVGPGRCGGAATVRHHTPRNAHVAPCWRGRQRAKKASPATPAATSARVASTHRPLPECCDT